MGQRTLPRRLAGVVAKDVLLGKLYPAIYTKIVRETPVEQGKVLFVENRLEEMPDAFTCVWDALVHDEKYHVRYISLKRRTVSFPQYVANCMALVRELATAQYVFLCDASDLVSCLPMRPATKVVQLWHACGAFKKWGISTADKFFGGAGWETRRHPFYRNLDLVTVSSPEVEWAYREAMMLEEEPWVVQPLGVSRTDVFFDQAFLQEARAAVQEAVPQARECKVLLYAPTFRGTTGHAKGPDQLDVRALRASLAGEWVLLIKHHPYVSNPPQIPQGCGDFAFDAGDMRIDQLLAAADACVTDYSSIVFEYSLFQRPMAFFAPDIANYDDWRGFYYDYEDLTPGPVFTQTSQLADWLSHVDECFDPDEMAAFRQRFMSACDGHATERILHQVGIRQAPTLATPTEPEATAPPLSS